MVQLLDPAKVALFAQSCPTGQIIIAMVQGNCMGRRSIPGQINGHSIEVQVQNKSPVYTHLIQCPAVALLKAR